MICYWSGVLFAVKCIGLLYFISISYICFKMLQERI